MISRVSVTELLDFQDCRRYWWLSNYGFNGLGGYSSKAPQTNLWLGGGLHEGLEAYFRSGRDPQRMLGVYDDWFKASSVELLAEFPAIHQTLIQELTDLYDLGRGMLTNFSIFDSAYPDALKGDVFLTEKKIVLEILPGVELVGKIDVVLDDNGDYWVVDHKSASSTPQNGGIDVDDQLTGYCYLLWKAYGIIPVGAIYNVLIKSLPKEPELLKPTKSVPVALSKSKSQSTVYELYYQKLESLNLPIQEYAEILSHFRNRGWSGFFSQYRSFRNERELLAYEARTQARIRDMIAVSKNPGDLAYPTPRARVCGYCSFLNVCKAMDDGGDPESLLQSNFIQFSFKYNKETHGQP